MGVLAALPKLNSTLPHSQWQTEENPDIEIEIIEIEIIVFLNYQKIKVLFMKPYVLLSQDLGRL